MGRVYDTVMGELYAIRREVLMKRRDGNPPKFSVWYGYEAECYLMQDREFTMMLMASPAYMDPTGKSRVTLMGFTFARDPGLPLEALTIHVDGKPYTTISLATDTGHDGALEKERK